MRAHLLVLIAAVAVACTREASDPPKTPLPTRQTTIDPVTEKLDTAREEAERRRQQADDAYK